MPAINDIDIGLTVLCSVARNGDTLSNREIADVCGCDHSYISHITRAALKKLAKEPIMQQNHRDIAQC